MGMLQSVARVMSYLTDAAHLPMSEAVLWPLEVGSVHLAWPHLLCLRCVTRCGGCLFGPRATGTADASSANCPGCGLLSPTC